MSVDLGNANGMGILYPSDNRHGDEDFFGNDDLVQPDPSANYYVREDIYYGVPTFRSAWWPAAGAGAFIGDQGADLGPMYDKLQKFTDGWGNLPGGCNGRLAYVGYTRDQYGSVIANCTVRCFRVSTGELMAQVTSNANGYYIATTPYSEAHFLTVHKSGPPDVAGASIDSLIPQ